jgi:hypothetical protein
MLKYAIFSTYGEDYEVYSIGNRYGNVFRGIAIFSISGKN